MEKVNEKQVSEREPKLLSVEEALSVLPEGETIHVFTNPTVDLLIGADWSREDIINLISSNDIREIGGRSCRAMGHGLVVTTGPTQENKYFIKTIDKIPEELF